VQKWDIRKKVNKEDYNEDNENASTGCPRSETNIER
jgi:hypothetical protein